MLVSTILFIFIVEDTDNNPTQRTYVFQVDGLGCSTTNCGNYRTGITGRTQLVDQGSSKESSPKKVGHGYFLPTFGCRFMVNVECRKIFDTWILWVIIYSLRQDRKMQPVASVKWRGWRTGFLNLQGRWYDVDGSEIPFPTTSQTTTVWMVLKPVVNNGISTTFPSTGACRISEPSTVSRL